MIKNLKAILLISVLCSCNDNIKQEAKPKEEVQSKNGEITELSGKLNISGIYPHLTTYSHGRLDGSYGFGSECGIGALAVWNNQLYMVNYAAHQPKGSEHKLYIIDEDGNMEIYSNSIGGTPAARMIHQESNQLLIGPYVIDSTGNIRVIPYSRMEGRLTAIARHLKNPKNMVYYYDMEGMLYEVNVHTLAVKKLFQDPLPGWHGKGAYTSQGRLVLSNNGEHASEGRVTEDVNDFDVTEYKWEDSWKIPKDGVFGSENFGILAEFDGDNFKVMERRQYTDVTTKNGINAVPNEESPLWAIGWDKKALRLKVLDHGKWSTYLLPKAAYNNDPTHGWFTEWPRIRSVGNNKIMMDMHGMFYDFPDTFSSTNTSGIKPMGSHLRYIPDFVGWNGQVVLATDETSVQGNPLAGQPQSNLWFGDYKQLSNWGPASGYGAIWLDEEVTGGAPSLPYLIAGFDNRMVHFQNNGKKPVNLTMEIDIQGDGNWKKLETIHLNPGEYTYYIFDKRLKAEWIRLIADTSSRLTAAFQFTDGHLKDTSERQKMFSGLADIDYTGAVDHARLYSNKSNFNLSVYAGTIKEGKFNRNGDYEFSKFDFDFNKGIRDSTASVALPMKNIWSEDDASIILKAKNYQLRLPKGNGDYSTKLPSGSARTVREVESERELANIAGTFYELPLFKVGQEPLYKMMRPVATHGKQISDFNTWNGLLVLSGVRMDVQNSNHIYKSEESGTALWFGGIDDLWCFGKPVGVGGPWKDTMVKANELSDRYLMTGYDKKKLTLKSDKDVKISLMVYVNHYLETSMLFKTFDLKVGKELEYEFPEGFSAHWVQVKSNKDCTATAWFTYE